MMMMGLDREIEKCKARLEKENHCIILICDTGEMIIMDLISGEARTAPIPIDEKHATMVAMMRAFK